MEINFSVWSFGGRRDAGDLPSVAIDSVLCAVVGHITYILLL